MYGLLRFLSTACTNFKDSVFNKVLTPFILGDSNLMLISLLLGAKWSLETCLIRYLRTLAHTFIEISYSQVDFHSWLDSVKFLRIIIYFIRKTGTILRAFERGQSGIGSFLQWTLFNILPTILELLLTVIVLLSYYSPWFALVTFITVAYVLKINKTRSSININCCWIAATEFSQY